MRRREGDVIEIPLGEEITAFGRVLTGRTLVEFFDLFVREGQDVQLETVVERPVLFRLWVEDMPFRGRWRLFGSYDLTELERRMTYRFFKQDPVTGQLSIYRDIPATGEWGEQPAVLSEIEGLECAAVWSAEHVEDRLRDHFAGRPNKWVGSLRPTPHA